MADKKGAKMEKKTENARRRFNLPDTESVIQDYRSYMKRKSIVGTPAPVPGKLIITQNYVLWASKFTSSSECVPFRKIAEVRKESSLLFNDAISLVLTSAAGPTPTAIADPSAGPTTFTFTGLMHRDETFELIHYMLQHPVSYVTVDEAPAQSFSAPSAASAAAPPTAAVTAAAVTPTSPAAAPSSTFDFEAMSATASSSSSFSSAAAPAARVWGTASSATPTAPTTTTVAGGTQAMETKVQVDLASGKLALRRAEEARAMGAATLTELARQGEVLDEMEQDVEHIHGNIDRAQRHIRGVESFAGAMANKMTSVKPGVVVPTRDHTITYERQEKPVDVPVLYKHPNDSLSPATMRLTRDSFAVLHRGETEPKESYPYSVISSLVLRSRPQHLDIRFDPAAAKAANPSSPDRVRFLMSYLQLVVNELSLRCGTEVPVIFEKNAKSFMFKDRRISYQLIGATLAVQAAKAEAKSSGAAQPRIRPPNSFVDSAPAEYRDALEEQDRDLELIGDAVGDVKAMAQAMRPTLSQQAEQITRVTARVDEADQRLQIFSLKLMSSE